MIGIEWIKQKEINEYFEWDDIQTKLAAIHGIDNLKRFMNPLKNELNSPYLLKNIDEAKRIIVEAIDSKKKISIHADVDADGCTSCTLMYNYLKRFTNKVTYFHAQRSLGHGVEISENDVPKGTELLLIIDSSTNSVESCKRISERGIEIVVLDHHEQDTPNPYCTLVNPQQEGCTYPNKQISAAVVAWKMCQVLDEHYATDYADDYYDLAAIGLVGDVMSLSEYENRYIVKQGINNIRNLGVRSLLEESKRDTRSITVTDISYLLTPIINAACRLDKIEVILELLVEKNVDKARELAKQAIKMNEERKKIQQYFCDKLSNQIGHNSGFSIIVDNEIGSGFKGLVAGKFCSDFKQTVLIVSEDRDGTLFGSYRYYGDDDFKSMLNSIPEIIYAAGHKTVGGVRFNKDDLGAVKLTLSDKIKTKDEETKIKYVMEFEVEQLNFHLIRDIEAFYEISGKCFETGKFLIKNLFVQKKDVIGKTKNTLKVPCVAISDTYFCSAEESLSLPSKLTLMKFNTTEDTFDDSAVGKEIQCVGSLNINEWTHPKTKKKTKNYQLFLDDYKVV